MLPVNRTKHPNCRYFLGPPGLQQLAMLRQGEQNLTEHTVPVFWPGPSAPSEPTEVRASSSSPGGLQPSIFLLPPPPPPAAALRDHSPLCACCHPHLAPAERSCWSCGSPRAGCAPRGAPSTPQPTQAPKIPLGDI